MFEGEAMKVVQVVQVVQVIQVVQVVQVFQKELESWRNSILENDNPVFMIARLKD
jgi:hypothetical protein